MKFISFFAKKFNSIINTIQSNNEYAPIYDVLRQQQRNLEHELKKKGKALPDRFKLADDGYSRGFVKVLKYKFDIMTLADNDATKYIELFNNIDILECYDALTIKLSNQYSPE